MLSVQELLLGLASTVAFLGRDFVDLTIALPAYGLGKLSRSKNCQYGNKQGRATIRLT